MKSDYKLYMTQSKSMGTFSDRVYTIYKNAVNYRFSDRCKAFITNGNLTECFLMKILYVCNEYPPAPYGGIGIFVKTLAENLVSSDIQCVVVGLYDQIKKYSVESSNGVEVRRARKKNWLLGKIHPVFQLTLERFQLSREVYKIERTANPDLIES